MDSETLPLLCNEDYLSACRASGPAEASLCALELIVRSPPGLLDSKTLVL